jgi:hypothetical protein
MLPTSVSPAEPCCPGGIAPACLAGNHGGFMTDGNLGHPTLWHTGHSGAENERHEQKTNAGAAAVLNAAPIRLLSAGLRAGTRTG